MPDASWTSLFKQGKKSERALDSSWTSMGTSAGMGSLFRLTKSGSLAFLGLKSVTVIVTLVTGTGGSKLHD